jgi:hypothetical protein
MVLSMGMEGCPGGRNQGLSPLIYSHAPINSSGRAYRSRLIAPSRKMFLDLQAETGEFAGIIKI